MSVTAVDIGIRMRVHDHARDPYREDEMADVITLGTGVQNYDWNSGELARYWGGRETLERVRQSLRARAEGRNEGGDTEVMRLVDEIVAKSLRNGQNF